MEQNSVGLAMSSIGSDLAGGIEIKVAGSATSLFKPLSHIHNWIKPARSPVTLLLALTSEHVCEQVYVCHS